MTRESFIPVLVAPLGTTIGVERGNKSYPLLVSTSETMHVPDALQYLGRAAWIAGGVTVGKSGDRENLVNSMTPTTPSLRRGEPRGSRRWRCSPGVTHRPVSR